jgi:hypothetical protein
MSTLAASIKDPAWLLDYKKDVHSQTGEDGIIEKILELIPDKDHWCVEFGAWDGLHLCNTRNLLEHKGYKSVLIEGNKARFKDLIRNFGTNKNVIPIESFVGFEPENNLDHLLEKTGIPIDFDFLSIDIDGNDYHVWKASTRYRPKVVIIEFNGTIPTHIDFIQPKDPSVKQGSGVKAMIELGKEKGYELVSILRWNAFFVRKEYFPLFEITDNSAETLRKDLQGITHMFVGYDGTVFFEGAKRLPWHGIPMDTSRMQPLPRILRRTRDSYSKPRLILFLLLTSPGTFLKEVVTRIGRRFKG